MQLHIQISRKLLSYYNFFKTSPLKWVWDAIIWNQLLKWLHSTIHTKLSELIRRRGNIYESDLSQFVMTLISKWNHDKLSKERMTQMWNSYTFSYLTPYLLQHWRKSHFNLTAHAAIIRREISIRVFNANTSPVSATFNQNELKIIESICCA